MAAGQGGHTHFKIVNIDEVAEWLRQWTAKIVNILL